MWMYYPEVMFFVLLATVFLYTANEFWVLDTLRQYRVISQLTYTRRHARIHRMSLFFIVLDMMVYLFFLRGAV